MNEAVTLLLFLYLHARLPRHESEWKTHGFKQAALRGIPKDASKQTSEAQAVIHVPTDSRIRSNTVYNA